MTISAKTRDQCVQILIEELGKDATVRVLTRLSKVEGNSSFRLSIAAILEDTLQTRWTRERAIKAVAENGDEEAAEYLLNLIGGDDLTMGTIECTSNRNPAHWCVSSDETGDYCMFCKGYIYTPQ